MELLCQTLQLTSSDYIQAASQCGGSGVNNVTQSSFTGAKGDVALCNFLSAKNNCIESTPKALITSIDQVEKLEFELTNCMYPVFPGAPVCPGTHMVLPAINLGNWKTETSFDPTDSPNAFKKIWTAISDSNSSSFTAFSWEGQLKCVVPPSFQQFAISAAASGLDLAEDEVKNERAPPERTSPSITNSVCNREGFFNLGVVPNLETIIPLAGVCCPTQVTAEICTPRRGKFFINVKDNVIKIATQWGLTERCYPYWPFPTDLQGLLQKHNLVSVAFGLTEFISSNGANFEMSLASETPGDKPVAVTGLTNKQCSGDGDCTNNYEECAVNKIYSYSGGKCVSGVCSYSTTTEKLTCAGGQTCEQASGSAPTCNACGGEGQPCCVESANNAFCGAGFGCLIDGPSARCTAQCGNANQPVCGGWNSRVEPCKDGTSIHDADSTHPYSYCK